jgi:hypothetical protein
MRKIIYAAILFASCSKDDAVLPKAELDIQGDANLGLIAYTTKTDSKGRTCMSCHTSPEGLDIVAFGKMNITEEERTIFKRSLDHVSREDAANLVAYFKTLRTKVTPNENEPPIKAPRGESPSQIWDGSTKITREQIASWNFWKIETGFEFPRWFAGDNTGTATDDNTDWLSEIGLPNEKAKMKIVFNEYVKNPTYDNLYRVIKESKSALTEGERHPGEHGYRDFVTSFDYQRWLATLYIQHIRRAGIQYGDQTYDGAEFSMLDPIWDAGNVARRSEDNGSLAEEIPNRLQNEMRWLYLAWLGNMGRRNSFETQYIGSALKDGGQRDLASLVILRSMLHRSPNSQRLFDDIFSMSYITSPNMVYRSMQFGLTEVIRRLQDEPSSTKLIPSEATVIIDLYEGQTKSNVTRSNMTLSEKSEILSLLDQVITKLYRMR